MMFYGNYSSFFPDISVHVKSLKTPGNDHVLKKQKSNNHTSIFGTLDVGKDNHTETLHLEVAVMRAFNSGQFIVNTICQTRTKEEIRVWVENGWIIIWSCVNDLSSNEHDQAVMTSYEGVEDLQSLSSEDFQEKLQELREIAKKYISSNLIDAMDWSPMGIGSSEGDPMRSNKCPYQD